MKNILFVLAIVLTVPAAAALAGGGKVPAPVNMPEGSSCSECGMAIPRDGRTASEVIHKNGKVDYFCDLGDMMVYYEVLKDKQGVAAIYVKDYESGRWVEGRSAAYLTGTKAATPMKYGILAFRDRASAEKFRAANGGEKTYTFGDIIASKVYRR